MSALAPLNTTGGPAIDAPAKSLTLGVEEPVTAGTQEAGRPAKTATVASRHRKIFAVAVEGPLRLKDQLERHLAAWEALAAAAIEPNPFYEPWMLGPAAELFGKGKRLIFVFIFASSEMQPSADPLLCGFFPLDLSKRYDGLGKPLPLATIGLWKHKYCYLCTPLVREGFAKETVEAFFGWLDGYAGKGSHGSALMDFRYIPEGPFFQTLAAHLDRSQRLHSVVQSFTRAILRRRDDAQDYLRRSLSQEHRKDFRRKERRLRDSGALEYAALEAGVDPLPWIEEYLSVEDRSWKGKQNCALTSTPGEREFFEQIALEAHARNRLMMVSLRQEGRAIASKCNFISGRGSYAFKIAFDERYAHWSPGMLLEFENIRQYHAREAIDWMDSCADPSNAMINRLWLDRLPIQSVAVGVGRRGELAVALMPLLKWLNRQIFRRDLARRRITRPIAIIEM